MLIEKDSIISSGNAICTVRFTQNRDELTGIFYVPVDKGKQIESEMLIQFAPNGVNVSKSGSLIGVVRSISQYPISGQGIQKSLGNAQLAQWMVSQGMGGAVEVNAISGNIVSQVFNFIFSFWSFGLMCWYSFTLAALVLFSIVILTLISSLFVSHVIGLQRNFTTAHNKTTAILQQIFSGLSKFRSAAAEEQVFRLWGECFTEEWKGNYKMRWNINYMSIITIIQSSLYTLLVYFVVMNYVNETDPETSMIKEGITYTGFLAFQAAAASFNSTIGGFVASVSRLLMIKPLIENMQIFLDEVPEISDDKPDADTLHGAIEVRNLSFAYSEYDPKVIKNVNFRIASGEHVAIVGRSGDGKSTLIRLLLGFEKPSQGVVLYDGQDLAEVNLSSVRSQMGVVLQNGQLMSGSIFTNIVGTSALTEADAWIAADAAGLTEDIKSMPMGMQTIISEGSSNISGGQSQRILIARALAGRPAVIIFDEATSVLDNRTQSIVTNSLDKMHATQIVVAHRLSTIRNVDRVIVVDKGQIVENGSFDELVAQGGMEEYLRVWLNAKPSTKITDKVVRPDGKLF